MMGSSRSPRVHAREADMLYLVAATTTPTTLQPSGTPAVLMTIITSFVTLRLADMSSTVDDCYNIIPDRLHLKKMLALAK